LEQNKEIKELVFGMALHRIFGGGLLNLKEACRFWKRHASFGSLITC
jgi:hypothetical protein